ncbi:MAG: alpha/beta hydrolase [Bacteroidales bacterium]|nr:alpha/beta hydrolase [Bacteroidales bacterium]MDD3200524.1 alpha/beta hydrolase [Bacteroidales bacterium]
MDIELHYEEKGSGEPLILLHGNGEESSYFTNQIDYFTEKYRVIAVDTRGHGLTPRGTAPFTIRQFADDLLYFMNEQLHLEKAHILGFSDGGNIALLFAIKYPEKVDRLIVDGANLSPRGEKLKYRVEIRCCYKKAMRKASQDTQALKEAELLGLMVNDPDIAVAELKKIKSKTLVMAGSRDMIKRKHTLLIGRSIPDAEIKLIKGDHFIANGNPVDFNRAVDQFLTKQ